MDGVRQRRAGLTKDKIISTALQLTESRSLNGWSVRDLADSLGVVPSVVYHYFPNKEALQAGVVERVVNLFPLPDPTLEWKAWFLDLFRGIRPFLLRYVGITERFTELKIPVGITAVGDIGCRKLMEAGFGPYTGVVYAMLFNSANHAASLHNARSPKTPMHRMSMQEVEQQWRPLHSEFYSVQVMMDSLIAPMASNAENEDEYSARYSELLIAALLDGVESLLPEDRRGTTKAVDILRKCREKDPNLEWGRFSH